MPVRECRTNPIDGNLKPPQPILRPDQSGSNWAFAPQQMPAVFRAPGRGLRAGFYALLRPIDEARPFPQDELRMTPLQAVRPLRREAALWWGTNEADIRRYAAAYRPGWRDRRRQAVAAPEPGRSGRPGCCTSQPIA